MLQTIYDLGGINKKLAIFIHHTFTSGTSLDVMKIFSGYIGNYMMGPITIPLILFAIYYHIKKTQSSKFCAKSINAIIVLFFSFTIAAIIAKTLKTYTSMPRPFCSLEDDLIQHLIPHNMVKCFRSFPSGHTVYFASIIFSFWGIMNKPLKLVGATSLILVMISRIALLRHYPSDVLASILICAASVTIVSKLVIKFNSKLRPHINEFCNCIKK